MAALTRALAVEWSRDEVLTNTIAPGVFRTALNADLLDNMSRGNELLMRTPMGKLSHSPWYKKSVWSFDSVQYTQEGLALTGTIGNATQLWINSLALKFTARSYAYMFRDKWRESYNSGFIWLDSTSDIGTGQTTVGLLSPGTAALFSVSIPNVKQTSNQIQIEVDFSGERYSYLK